jgi:hypothetical protein
MKPFNQETSHRNVVVVVEVYLIGISRLVADIVYLNKRTH